MRRGKRVSSLVALALVVGAVMALTACQAFTGAKIVSYTVQEAIDQCAVPVGIWQVNWRKMPIAQIREEWSGTEGAKRLGHGRVNGFTSCRLIGGVKYGWRQCVMFAEEPLGDWDGSRWGTVCHELKHAELGNWHAN